MKTLIVCFVCLLFVGCITPNQNDLRPETDAEITACKKRVDKLQKELNEKKDNSGVTIFDEQYKIKEFLDIFLLTKMAYANKPEIGVVS